MSAAKKHTAQAPAQPKAPAPKSAPTGKWGARLLLDKTCELLRSGSAPQSQTLGNALAIAASDQLDLERLSAGAAPLPESARRAVLQAMDKAKFPGVSWESVVEPMLSAVWREKRRPAAAAKPQAKVAGPARSGPATGAKPAARKPGAKAGGKPATKAPTKAPTKAAPAAPVIVRRASKLLNRPS